MKSIPVLNLLSNYGASPLTNPRYYQLSPWRLTILTARLSTIRSYDYGLTLCIFYAMMVLMGTVAAMLGRAESSQPPSSLPDLIQSTIRDGNGAQTPQAIETLRRGQSAPIERLRVRAFELYVEGAMTLGEISKKLGCSKQYLYKIAKTQNWVDRKTRMQAMALVGQDDKAIQAMEIARAELQAKVQHRILELERLCEGGNIKAILAWLQMAGLGKEDTGSRVPRSVEVFNDLSDNRQVTVVNDPKRDQAKLEAEDSSGGSSSG